MPAEVIDLVAKRGHGSARDALSVLDQVAAAGGIDDDAPVHRRGGRGACASATSAGPWWRWPSACGAGHDPRRLAVELLEHLRQAFLATVARGLVGLPDDEVARVESQAAALGRAAIVRAMEVLGDALVAMREAPDPRVLLEVALVRLCRPEADVVARRPARADRAPGAGAGRPAAGRRPPAAPAPRPPAAAAPAAGARRRRRRPRRPPAGAAPRPAGARPAPGRPLGGVRAAPPPGRRRRPPPPPAPAAARRPPPPAPPPAAGRRRRFPTRDELTLAWGDTVLGPLSPRGQGPVPGGPVRRRAEPGVATFALPNAIHRDRCAEVQGDVEQALAAHFGRRVPLQLLVEAEVGAPAGPPRPTTRSTSTPATSVTPRRPG